jgi:hypothetical protein
MWRRLRRTGYVLGAIVGAVAIFVAVTWVTLSAAGSATPNAAVRGQGHDAEWLGHAWVDGRRSQADVDTLAAALRDTGVRDLFVHAGPLNHDGTLDRALRPQARWFTAAIHAALPGVRVQAWLGAHPIPGQLDLGSSDTRSRIVTGVGDILDDGFDGVHLDLEPVDEGDADYVTLLRDARVVIRQKGALLSLSASLLAPWPGMAAVVGALPGRYGMWSADYLRELAAQVDQVAIMAYDTWSWTPSMYSGYVRHVTATALDVVPDEVELFIGVPAYRDDNNRHRRDVETVAAALRGVRLGLGDRPGDRHAIGVAIYVDFTVTADDWAVYRSDWE